VTNISTSIRPTYDLPIVREHIKKTAEMVWEAPEIEILIFCLFVAGIRK